MPDIRMLDSCLHIVTPGRATGNNSTHASFREAQRVVNNGFEPHCRGQVGMLSVLSLLEPGMATNLTGFNTLAEITSEVKKLTKEVVSATSKKRVASAEDKPPLGDVTNIVKRQRR